MKTQNDVYTSVRSDCGQSGESDSIFNIKFQQTAPKSPGI